MYNVQRLFEEVNDTPAPSILYQLRIETGFANSTLDKHQVRRIHNDKNNVCGQLNFNKLGRNPKLQTHTRDIE